MSFAGPAKLKIVVSPLVPMRLSQVSEPFDSPGYLFELKWDGFRALALVADERAGLISRRLHEYRTFQDLSTALAAVLNGRSAVLDGEIVALDSEENPASMTSCEGGECRDSTLLTCCHSMAAISALYP